MTISKSWRLLSFSINGPQASTTMTLVELVEEAMNASIFFEM
jgi:hypothetical protein